MQVFIVFQFVSVADMAHTCSPNPPLSEPSKLASASSKAAGSFTSKLMGLGFFLAQESQAGATPAKESRERFLGSAQVWAERGSGLGGLGAPARR